MKKITNQDLDSAIERINQLSPQKIFGWHKTQVYYMADNGSRKYISAKTKREFYDQLWAFIEGMEILRFSYKIELIDFIEDVSEKAEGCLVHLPSCFQLSAQR